MYLYQYERAEIKHKKRVSLFGGTINIYIYRFISLNIWGFACSVLRDNSCTNYEVTQLNRAEKHTNSAGKSFFCCCCWVGCWSTYILILEIRLCALWKRFTINYIAATSSQPNINQQHLLFYYNCTLNLLRARICWWFSTKSAGWTHLNLHASVDKYEIISWSFPKCFLKKASKSSLCVSCETRRQKNTDYPHITKPINRRWSTQFTWQPQTTYKCLIVASDIAELNSYLYHTTYIVLRCCAVCAVYIECANLRGTLARSTMRQKPPHDDHHLAVTCSAVIPIVCVCVVDTCCSCARQCAALLLCCSLHNHEPRGCIIGRDDDVYGYYHPLNASDTRSPHIVLCSASSPCR